MSEVLVLLGTTREQFFTQWRHLSSSVLTLPPSCLRLSSHFTGHVIVGGRLSPARTDATPAICDAPPSRSDALPLSDDAPPAGSDSAQKFRISSESQRRDAFVNVSLENDEQRELVEQLRTRVKQVTSDEQHGGAFTARSIEENDEHSDVVERLQQYDVTSRIEQCHMTSSRDEQCHVTSRVAGEQLIEVLRYDEQLKSVVEQSVVTHKLHVPAVRQTTTINR
jgi:hypothetical protein